MSSEISETSNHFNNIETKAISSKSFEIKNNLEMTFIQISENPETSFTCLKRVNKFEMICHFFPCMKIFKSRENLDLHILNIHLKIKPFKCDHCDKKFSQRNGKIFLKIR